MTIDQRRCELKSWGTWNMWFFDIAQNFNAPNEFKLVVSLQFIYFSLYTRFKAWNWVTAGIIGYLLKCRKRFYILNMKKLTSLHYCVRATKSHIQNSRNHFTRTQSDRTMNWLPLQTHATCPHFNLFHPALSRKLINVWNWNFALCRVSSEPPAQQEWSLFVLTLITFIQICVQLRHMNRSCRLNVTSQAHGSTAVLLSYVYCKFVIYQYPIGPYIKSFSPSIVIEWHVPFF